MRRTSSCRSRWCPAFKQNEGWGSRFCGSSCNTKLGQPPPLIVVAHLRGLTKRTVSLQLVDDATAERCSMMTVSQRVGCSNPIRVRLIVVVSHVVLFSLTWIACWRQTQPLANGPAFWPFSVLFLVDLPISAIASGIMWGKSGFLYGLILWGVLGTLWWYWLSGVILKRLCRKLDS